MKLKEQFFNIIRRHNKELREKESVKCVEVAEEFACDFTEWFWYHGTKYWRGERRDYLSMKEILEIYKKEKG